MHAKSPHRLSPALLVVSNSAPARCRQRLGRAALAIAITTGLIVADATASHVLAQSGNWLDELTGGFGTAPAAKRQQQDRTPEERRADRQREQERGEPAAVELRKDDIPLLSDETRQALEAAIVRYTDIVANGGWRTINPGGRSIQPGDEDERIGLVARRLLITGDLPPKPNRTVPYQLTPELEAAVKVFQNRHGMKPTGIVDRSTIQMMNVTADTRLAQLRISLVRTRELANQIGNVDRYVLVNIPAFQLEAVERSSVAQRHRVITGRAERQTPGVKAMIKNINFFPFWHVPESVAHLDLIPKVKKEPEYLAKEKIRVLKTYKGEEVPVETIDWNAPQVLTYKFQQDPGPQNALGLVRIDMPNEHTVYMHDTPMKQLFGQRGRAYSAGCVRIDGVFDLVAWILKDVPTMDRAQIDVILRDGQPVDIPLPRPVPVHFVYQTAWASQDGRVDFRPDLYARDGIQAIVASYSTEGVPSQGLAP
jgi:L,D-transpeptidase YcbB